MPQNPSGRLNATAEAGTRSLAPPDVEVTRSPTDEPVPGLLRLPIPRDAGWNDLSYRVRIHQLEQRRDPTGRIVSARIRWTVNHRLHIRSFGFPTQAASYRSELLTAARRGEAFRTDTGEPATWRHQTDPMTWFQLAEAFAQTKWADAAPNTRRGIAEALSDTTEALTTANTTANSGTTSGTGAARPDRAELRAAMRWTFSTRINTGTRSGTAPQPPDQIRATLTWLRRHTVDMDAFDDRTSESRHTRAIVDRLARTKTGTPAAATTTNRKRMVIHNAFEYALEIGQLDHNPLDRIHRRPSQPTITVDPRAVINPAQARRFLIAVQHHSHQGAQLVAFFGCLYYAGLRPAEATELRTANLINLPSQPGQWGELRLTQSTPRSGRRWTDTHELRQLAPLKHRAIGDSRSVPMHPDLVQLLRHHLDQHGHTPDGHLFPGLHDNTITDHTYLQIFHEARQTALTAEEAQTPLMTVPYALRYAAVSTWLRATGDPAQVAAWAGHSIPVLLRVYAQCIDGTRQEDLDRILEATRPYRSDPVETG